MMTRPMATPEPTPLVLPALPAGRIIAHGVSTYPREACGLLVGIDSPGRRTIVDAVAIDNVWDNPDQRHCRFTIDPKQQMHIERSLEGTGKSVVGFYHTHPDHPAQPSAFDLEAAWAFYSYVIVQVAGGQATAMRSWLLDDQQNRFVEQPINSAD
jgi:proteasome lid subunit RPN8/RPN11